VNSEFLPAHGTYTIAKNCSPDASIEEEAAALMLSESLNLPDGTFEIVWDGLDREHGKTASDGSYVLQVSLRDQLDRAQEATVRVRVHNQGPDSGDSGDDD
jgi:hypothetical protein